MAVQICLRSKRNVNHLFQKKLISFCRGYFKQTTEQNLSTGYVWTCSSDVGKKQRLE